MPPIAITSQGAIDQAAARTADAEVARDVYGSVSGWFALTFAPPMLALHGLFHICLP
jgi:hypothetical protein